MRAISSHCFRVTVPRATSSSGETGSSCLPTCSFVLGVRIGFSNLSSLRICLGRSIPYAFAPFPAW